MVDAVVSFVLQRLGDYLIQEAVLLGGVRNEVESLRNELEWMQCFIKDAEEKQNTNHLIRKWVSDIKDLASDTSDVLDKFLLGSGRVIPPQRSPTGFFASFDNCFCIKGREEINLYSIGKDIEALRKRIGDISRKRELYGLERIGTTAKKEEEESKTRRRLKELRRAASFAVEENIVGFEDDNDKLLGKLLDDGEPHRLVISIFGMGGLGKTTIARKLYHNNEVRRKFDCCAWISVSQDYRTQDLLLRIIKSFETGTKVEVLQNIRESSKMVKDQDLEKMMVEDLERYLHEFLKECSYLLVVDDVWEREVWECLKRAFPDRRNGSRVIITTRIKEVAERSDERTHAHKLPFLRPEESWQLFCEKAFSRNLKTNQGLEKLGREMVQKCSGLPLAIVVLGGLLSTKKPQEWLEIRNHIWRHLRDDSIHISYLLDLSFNDLDEQLKDCFLYLGLFPEDFEIVTERLIRLWVAEGFIPQDEDQTMEDVAKHNLDKLINRSLIQIEKICWGKVATCRVHDLLHDLAIQKAKELNFIHIFDETKNSAHSSTISSCRRQAIYSETERCLWLQHSNPLSHSLLLFTRDSEWYKIIQQLTLVCAKFNVLKVLNVEAHDIEKSVGIPKDIEKLIHLKYLRLNGGHIRIPESIVNLQSLQTLDVYGMNSVQLPTKICKLLELRHLIGNFKGPLHIESLTNLQTLRYVRHDMWSKVNPEKLVNIRELQIYPEKLTDDRKEFIFDSIAKLKSLRYLSVHIRDGYSFSSLQPLSHCQYLVYLRLKGKIEKLPGDMQEILPYLECLSLEDSNLKDDPMYTLEKLPNLVILDLHCGSYNGKKLTCTWNGFPRLEILNVVGCTELKELEVNEGGMPMLKGLNISQNTKLTVPERLRSISLPSEWECWHQEL